MSSEIFKSHQNRAKKWQLGGKGGLNFEFWFYDLDNDVLAQKHIFYHNSVAQ